MIAISKHASPRRALMDDTIKTPWTLWTSLVAPIAAVLLRYRASGSWEQFNYWSTWQKCKNLKTTLAYYIKPRGLIVQQMIFWRNMLKAHKLRLIRNDRNTHEGNRAYFTIKISCTYFPRTYLGAVCEFYCKPNLTSKSCTIKRISMINLERGPLQIKMFRGNNRESSWFKHQLIVASGRPWICTSDHCLININ